MIYAKQKSPTLKTLGVHDVLVRVHPEITSTIKVNVVAE